MCILIHRRHKTFFHTRQGSFHTQRSQLSVRHFLRQIFDRQAMGGDEEQWIDEFFPFFALCFDPFAAILVGHSAIITAVVCRRGVLEGVLVN